MNATTLNCYSCGAVVASDEPHCCHCEKAAIAEERRPLRDTGDFAGGLISASGGNPSAGPDLLTEIVSAGDIFVEWL